MIDNTALPYTDPNHSAKKNNFLPQRASHQGPPNQTDIANFLATPLISFPILGKSGKNYKFINTMAKLQQVSSEIEGAL